MKIINKSRKIIGINGEPLLPGASMTLPAGYEKHPSICDYLAKGILTDAEREAVSLPGSGISDVERKRIAEEAIAEYKKKQEGSAAAKETAAQNEKETEIKAVKNMRKPELLTKALSIGIPVNDDDTVDVLKDKIVAFLSQQETAHGSV